MFFEQIIPTIRSNTELFGLFTFFIGLIVGHRLNISRDKRTDFNNAVTPIKEKLIREKEIIINDNFHTQGPTETEITLLKEHLPWYSRTTLSHAWNKYQKDKCRENREINGFGGDFYKDNREVLKSINTLLRTIRRK